MSNCPNCGNELYESGRFCSQCGKFFISLIKNHPDFEAIEKNPYRNDSVNSDVNMDLNEYKNQIKILKVYKKDGAAIYVTKRILNDVDGPKNNNHNNKGENLPIITTLDGYAVETSCSSCGIFFNKKTPDQRFCSERCKEAYYKPRVSRYVKRGFGYIRIAKGGNAFKVGFTTNPLKRCGKAQKCNHRHLLLAYQNVEETPELNFEEFLFNKLKNYRRKILSAQEWFELNDESKSIIEECCKISILDYDKNEYIPKLTVIESLIPDIKKVYYNSAAIYIGLTIQDPAVVIGSGMNIINKFHDLRTDQHSTLILIKTIKCETLDQAKHIESGLKNKFNKYRYKEGGKDWFKPEILAHINQVDKYVACLIF